jgi:hypothetical protein
MLFESIENTLNELKTFLLKLNNTQYSNCFPDLSNASIGAHTRHIIELFQCLENQYISGSINYDDRKRDINIQTDINSAIIAIENIILNLKKPNIDLILKHNINESSIEIKTNYERELLYNLEHCVHHQALIKVAILQSKIIAIDKNFGVAPSTISYRKQCVQ